MAVETPAPSNFLRALIEADLQSGRHTTVATRFPPEPNGYLHIGHAKSICLNFGLASDFGGRCHLRYDDTNPEKEEMEYIRAIERDVRWLGFDWGKHLFYASDFFEDMYRFAEGLIEDGKAYVDSQTDEEIRATRGTVTEAGTPSPYRDRPVAESLDLFRRMCAGEFPDGAHVLRAKIDMGAVNMKMRDPLLYRIRHTPHPHVGDKWPIYPFYDYAHPLEDALEGITHSFCTLEFDNNRELYDWVLDNVRRDWNPRPRQYEFARLDLEYTVMSKRRLLTLVKEGHVDGWDDPRMPTLAGLRRRGVTPGAIREFSERIGVSKAANLVDYGLLEACLRDDLDRQAPRRMAVLDPLPLVLENWPAGTTDAFELADYPAALGAPGSRTVPFGGTVLVERDDFAETPPPGWHRLAPGAEVRLRGAWIVRCTGFDTDGAGRVIGLRGTYDPNSRGANAADGRKIKGTIHWVSADHAVDVPTRVYEQLFKSPRPAAIEDFHGDLNPDSMHTVTARAEPAVATMAPGTHVQLERLGYFFADPVDSAAGAPVLNRTVALKDTWSRAKAEEPVAKPAHTPRLEAGPKAPSERPARTTEQDARYALYVNRGLEVDDADLIARDDALATAFTEALSVHGNAKAIANWLVNDLRAALKERPVLPFGGAEVAELVALIDAGRISSRGAKDVFAVLLAEGGHPAAIVKARGWEQVSDESAIAAAVDAVLAELPDKVAEYRGGRTGLLGLFTGQVMKRTGGKANPQLLKQLLEARLGA